MRYQTVLTLLPLQVVEVKDEGGRLMNDFTGRVKREEWKPPEVSA